MHTLIASAKVWTGRYKFSIQIAVVSLRLLKLNIFRIDSLLQHFDEWHGCSIGFRTCFYPVIAWEQLVGGTLCPALYFDAVLRSVDARRRFSKITLCMNEMTRAEQQETDRSFRSIGFLSHRTFKPLWRQHQGRRIVENIQVYHFKLTF